MEGCGCEVGGRVGSHGERGFTKLRFPSNVSSRRQLVGWIELGRTIYMREENSHEENDSSHFYSRSFSILLHSREPNRQAATSNNTLARIVQRNLKKVTWWNIVALCTNQEVPQQSTV